MLGKLGSIRENRLESRLIWILGSPRSGSTWLVNLLGDDPEAVILNEPAIGMHLGTLAMHEMNLPPIAVPLDQMRMVDIRAGGAAYFFSERYERTWRPMLRRLLLARLLAEVRDRSPARSSRGPVLIKEPAGSQAADLLLSLTPGAQLVFLVRDGRDVLDSLLDAMSEGGWVANLAPGFRDPTADRESFIRAHAHLWVARTHFTQIAYRNHDPDRRVMVRYEDLRFDTEKELERVASALGVRIHAETSARTKSFEAVPPGDRGKGKFVRSASPGLWRKNLSLSEQALLHEIMAEKLSELGYS